MKIHKIVEHKRKSLKETKTEFGKRFGVGKHAIYQWETNKRSIPNEVVDFCLNVRGCMFCRGNGVIAMGDLLKSEKKVNSGKLTGEEISEIMTLVSWMVVDVKNGYAFEIQPLVDWIDGFIRMKIKEALK